MSELLVDGPGLQGAMSVSTTPLLLKVGATPLTERQRVSILPTNGIIYFGHDNTVSSTTGTPIFKNQYIDLEAGTSLDIWLVAASGTINVRITERG